MNSGIYNYFIIGPFIYKVKNRKIIFHPNCHVLHLVSKQAKFIQKKV